MTIIKLNTASIESRRWYRIYINLREDNYIIIWVILINIPIVAANRLYGSIIYL